MSQQTQDNWADSTSVVIFGLGPVGEAVLRAASHDPRFEVVGCVDPREDREEIAPRAGFEGPTYADAASVVALGDVVGIVCTSSTVKSIAPLVGELIERGFDVVSTCEELIAPPADGLEDASALDRAAEDAGRAVIAAGVNPGFVMDVLPAIMTMPVRDVRRVRVYRSVDVSQRRLRLQEKVGVGLDPEEFIRRRDRDGIGHVGLANSLVYLAKALGWTDKTCSEQIEPVVDGERGLGVRHVATVADSNGDVLIEGLLEMYAGADNVDRIEIDGVPGIRLTLEGGIAGDEATVSAVLNSAARVRDMGPGLHGPILAPLGIWNSHTAAV